MTVEERLGQGKGNSHGGRDEFPVGMRVLAVDDDPTCLKLLETLLLRCRYHVTTTGQAVTALKMLRENKDRFDLVISDVHMPDMDGFKLLELVGLEMDLPVIMLSGNGETQTVMKGITHGACDYLLKPVRLEELRNIWQHVVRRRRCDARNRCSSKNDDAGQKMQPTNPDGEQGGANSSRKNLKKGREENGEDEDDSDDNSNENGDSSSQKKPRVVWSVELHRKFVAAVNQLGIDKAVPKKILDLMNVENITRENVASHLQKYRLYLKRLSNDASRQANLAAAFGGRHPTYINMNALESFKNYHALGRYRQLPTVASPQSSSLLARMNSPSAFGVTGLLPSQPGQLSHTQHNVGASLKDLDKFQNNSLGGIGHSTVLKGAPMSLQEASKCFPTGPSGNSFANISNGAPLPPANKMLSRAHESSNQAPADMYNAVIGDPVQFTDHRRCTETWQSAVPSNFPTSSMPTINSLGPKDRMPQTAPHMNAPKIEPLTNFGAPSSHIPMLGNGLQSQVTSLASSTTPMASFDQEAVLFNYGSHANSGEVLHNNLAFSPSINSTLPDLRIDDSVMQRQNASGMCQAGSSIHPVQDGSIDRPSYSNDLLLGTRKIQSGLSGGLDDIVIDMFKPDRDDAIPFMEGDWELVSMS